MAINIGYIEGTCADRDVVVRVYYDNTQPASDSQPLIDGPRGWCLDITNVSGRLARLSISGGAGQTIDMAIQKGDPVTTGPQSGRSRTASDLAKLGYTTRGSVGNFEIDCG